MLDEMMKRQPLIINLLPIPLMSNLPMTFLLPNSEPPPGRSDIEVEWFL